MIEKWGKLVHFVTIDFNTLKKKRFQHSYIHKVNWFWPLFSQIIIHKMTFYDVTLHSEESWFEMSWDYWDDPVCPPFWVWLYKCRGVQVQVLAGSTLLIIDSLLISWISLNSLIIYIFISYFKYRYILYTYKHWWTSSNEFQKVYIIRQN